MCGISGVFYAENKLNQAKEWIESAIQLQHHRGPDNNGIKINEKERLILGHNRLSIIDLSFRANQPLSHRHLDIVLNGELYNHKTFNSYSLVNDDFGYQLQDGDTLNFLKLICNSGFDNAIKYAEGMYAFALHSQDTNEIILCVDQTAQKPLYYYQSEDEFYFASSPVVLYSLKDKWELDTNALNTYWHLGALIGENQLFKGIKKLTAGQCLTYNHKNKTITKRHINKINFNPAVSTSSLTNAINRSIDEIKESDVPVSIFLSGGIDSTIVASRFANTNTIAIHLDSEETQYAQYVANKFNLKLHIVNPKDYSMDEILTDYVIKSGEPTTAGSIPWIVAKEASQLSKVAVIANGADELFFGYNRLRGDGHKESMFQNNHLFRGSVFDHYKLNRYRQQFDSKPSSRMTDLMNFVQYDINRTLDFASMCHSIEMRSPFLSSDVISQALSIRESEHICEGNKTILKRMLWNMGFDEKFTNRPKQGFSLFQKPTGTKELQNIAYEWCIENGYLDMDNPDSISERDKSYLKNSALGFYYFYQLFKHKIK